MERKEKLLVVENLSVSYDNKKVLEGINMEAHRGEFTCIVGKSGSGKTSLLRAIANLIDYEGSLKVPKKLGFVFQNYVLYPWLTVTQNIKFGLKDGDKKNKAQKIEELLSLVEMSDYGNRYPAQLSGGQAQRIAIARALAPDPELLLLDEPFSALDYLTRQRIEQWFLDFWSRTDKTILMVTHDLEAAILLSDSIVLIHDRTNQAKIDIDFPRPRAKQLKYSQGFMEIHEKLLTLMNFETG